MKHRDLGLRITARPGSGPPSRPGFRLNVRPGLALSLAWRGLVRDPGSTALAVTILALGISLPATFFSFLVGATRPLPVPEGNRVVRVDVVQPSRDGRPLPVTRADLEALRGTAALRALGGFRTFEGTLVDRTQTASRISAAALTPDVLPLLRVGPELGRLPAPDEGDQALLIGHGLWEDLYDGDPSVLGRSVEVDGGFRTIVGVLPEGFGFPFKQNAWIVSDPPLSSQESLDLVGRLADGAEPEAATAEVAPRWLRRDPERAADLTGGVATVRAFTGGRGERDEAVAFAGLVLVGVCLLLIACANVANLLLVRATERVRALGIQVALGAGRMQIGAQLLFESFLVAAAGGAAGILLATWAVQTAQRTLSTEHFGYFWMHMAIDGHVLGFTLLLVAGTALTAGILPIVRVLRVDVQRVLKEEGAAASVGGGGVWSRMFVTLQLALSCGAVVAAALTGSSLLATRHLGAELPVHQVLLGSIDLSPELGHDQRDAHLRALDDALAATPGVRVAALALGAPGYFERSSLVELQGSALELHSTTTWNAVTPSFLDVFDQKVRAGRNFTLSDDDDAPRVALVSESFARRFSADTPVLGRAVRLSGADSTAWFTVVGVVSDLHLGAGPQERSDRVFVPLEQVSDPSRTMALLRADGDASALASALRATVAEVDPTLPVWDVRTLADAQAYIVRVPRALATVALAGGAAGLFVAAVGLYGLLAFRVRQRKRELGVRLALGADAVRLVRGVFGVALRQLLPAVAVGLIGAWIASPVLQAMLLGGNPRALGTYAVVGVGFVVAGLAAALLPALRAGAVNPASVLRGE